MMRTYVLCIISLIFKCNSVFSQCGYTWGVWSTPVTNSGTTTASAVLNSNGQNIGMTMSANYSFGTTPGIWNYAVFSPFSDSPPNGTVPQITWSAVGGGTTTMCFSQPVVNPVLLLSSIGAPSLPVTLGFDQAFNVLFQTTALGGSISFNSSTNSLTGAEGYCIIEFPGTFNCVSIISTTPEFYTNLTWGIKNPPQASYTFTGSCLNDAVNFSATTASSIISTYAWDFGDGSPIVASPNPSHSYSVSGTYTVGLTVTAVNGCTNTVTQTLTIGSPTISAIANATLCSGDTFTITPSGASNYTVMPGNLSGTSFTVSPTSSTTYSIIGVNSMNCASTNTVNSIVTVNPLPSVTVNSPVVCGIQTVTLSALGASSYTWSTGTVGANTIVTATITTNYSVMASDAFGCTTSITTSVTVNPITTISVNSPTICINQAALLIASGATSYTWSTGANSSTISPSPAVATQYTVSGSLQDCVNSTVASVGVINVNAQYSGFNSETIVVGNTVDLVNTSSGSLNYQWYVCDGSVHTSTNVTVPLLEEVTCCIKLKAFNSQFVDSVTKCIDVVAKPFIFIPNVFSPNGDGVNDKFKITALGLQNLSCLIYDRWGLKLYEWDGINGFWDGNVSQGTAPDGTYFFILNYTDASNNTKVEKGFLLCLDNLNKTYSL